MSDTINISTVASAIRAILRNDHVIELTQSAARLPTMLASLRDLEARLPSRESEAFETSNVTSFGYATVLGWLAEYDPLTLESLPDPVRDTIQVGLKATALCHRRGLKVVKVQACDHVRQRYSKVTTVNAYPIYVLAEVMAEWVPPTDTRGLVLPFSDFLWVHNVPR